MCCSVSGFGFGNIPPFYVRGTFGASVLALPAAGSAALTDKIVNITTGGVVQTETLTQIFALLGSNSPSWTVGPWTWTATHVDSVADTIASYGLDEDTTSSIRLVNYSATNAIFSPTVLLTGSNNNRRMVFSGQGTLDTGSTPIVNFDSRIGTTVAAFGSATSATTRPIYGWFNNGTQVMGMSAAGGLSVTGGTTPSLSVGASGTALTQIRVYSPSITPVAVLSLTSVEQTFTVTGLATTDKVSLNSIAALGDGLIIAGVRVSATDTLAIRFANLTLGSLTPAAGVYPVVATRS